MIEIKTPPFPESIADGEIATWHVEVGEMVRRDQVLVDIETDKVVLEVVAPADGKLTAIHKAAGETVLTEELLGEFEAGSLASSPPETPSETSEATSPEASPAARKMAAENNLDLGQVVGSGKAGRITKQDVLAALARPKPASQAPAAEHRLVAEPATTPAATSPVALPTSPFSEARTEQRVPMTRLRASIAERLVQAQQTAAMLTTFNEIDMTAIMQLRARYKDEFADAHQGVRLGFMSFFIRASIEALKRFPAVNASIDGKDVVYHGYQDIGVAVSSPRGLVVPVIRDADRLNMAELEAQVRAFGEKAGAGKLTMEELTGGTFTLSNGGVFGSLLSTPILNPPQTGILGMHKIQERPVAVAGEIVIKPMMYVALSYDHRLIDGQEAVRFLVTIKEFLEEPARLLLNI